MYADWTTPTFTPPTCPTSNPACNTPLNVGAAAQTKGGGLIVANVLGVNPGFLVLNGNVGIGTAAPTSKLFINNGGTGGAGDVGLREHMTISSLAPNIWFEDKSASPTNYFIHLNSPIFTIGRDSGTSISDDLVLNAGNVGIGDTTPTTKLDVTGAIHATADVCTDLAGGKCLSTVGDGGGLTGGGTINFLSKFTGASVLGNSQVFDNGSFVGIGTASPTRKLEVSGAATGIKVTDIDPAGNAFIELSTNDGGSSYFQNVAGRTRIHVGGAERMSFLNTGNVGIGDPTPTYKLDVGGGDINTTGVYRVGGIAGIGASCPAGQTASGITMAGGIVTSAGVCAPIGGGGGGLTGTGLAGQVTFWNSATNLVGSNNLFWNNTTGRLGIGTASPTRKLEVSGATTGIKVTDTDPAGNAFIELSTVDGGVSLFQNVAGRTRIYIGGERMTFLNNGDVGIGITAPTEKLHVNGNITATRVFNPVYAP